MAQFIHSNQSAINGPFLIDRSQLESLDETLETEWKRLEEQALIDSLDRTLDRAGEKEATRQKREYFLLLKGGITAQVTSFKEAMREPDLQDKEPIGLSVSMENGKRTCNILLNHTACRIEVGPKRDQFAQQSLVVLKNWQSSIRPPFWQELWRGFSPMHWGGWILGILLLFVWFSPAEKSGQVSNEVLQLAMSTNSLSVDQQGRAMQLLLIKTYSVRDPGAKLPGWFWFLLFGGFPYCIALSFYPKVAIAIGAGEQKVQFWRRYSTFIMITAPAFVFVTFLWPKIEDIVRNHF